ncbi:S49 family peptidase [Oceanicella actignis]|uniref:Signal peptide peptidase SppA n=1 Tax=Oceanicella actignis TaxID=1189325 RepID=A0A1M7SRL7_9RHOB|nr:S49 family peptidase [Oceanicella actignis]SES68234.1 signal peptide peptidase SppA [Oceanicella actignis]SHN61213.1 signal peptide peptidase SppA [Oceanicella actignis]
MKQALTDLRRKLRRRPLAAVVRLSGPIGPSGRLGRALSDQSVAPAIEAAFAARPDAVALAINSPGGAAAQSAMIAARIRRLADRHEVPVLAFCEDVAASGGYWIACAADEIYADAASIVGSIGVIWAGFGLHELIARHGVERRVHAAGERKAMLDMFRPEDPEDVARLRRMQDAIHAAFIEHVRARRGARLTERARFDGSVWVGAEAIGTGLIDGLGHLEPVLRARLGDSVRFVEFGARKGLAARLMGAGAGAALGSDLAQGVAEGAEARALWAQWGI